MADLAPQLLAALKGDKGLYPDGLFSVDKSYRKDSIVKWDGSQWRALQLVPPGTTPVVGAYWERWIDGTPVADAAQVAADRVLSQAAAATSTAVMDSVSAAALLVAGSLTAAQIAAQSAVAVSGLANLSAAARAILLDSSTTAAYVYDTTRDEVPDWTSKVNNSLTAEPLNTATRGSKAQHPRLMIIVASGTSPQVTIFDGDDPTAPMWKVWLGAGTTNLFIAGVIQQIVAITARNGAIAFAMGGAGKICIDLVADKASWFRQAVTPNSGNYQGNLAEGNSGKGYTGTLATWFDGPPTALVSGVVNHVALTVLPNTPPNPNRLGLPSPAAAVGTAGGVSVIRPDGTIINSGRTDSFGRVAFDLSGTLIACTASANSTLFMWDYPSYLSAGFPLGPFLSHVTNPASVGIVPLANVVLRGAGDRIAFGGPGSGLTLIRRHRTILGASAVEYKDEWRSTGQLIGQTRMASAESARVVSPLQSIEMLTNGSFATDLSGWGNINSGTGFSPPTWDAGNGGRVALQRVDGTNLSRINQTITTVVGQTYAIRIATSSIACAVWVGTVNGAGDILQFIASVGTSTVIFRAKTTSVSIMLFSSTNATTGYVDDISIKAVIADHSWSNNHLEVTGTLNRSVVATGAELAAVNGFSTSNYAQAQYSATLDPGVGEFSVPCAVVTNVGISKQVTFLDRATPSGTGAYYRLLTDGTGKPRFIISDGTNVASVIAPNVLPAGPHRIRGIRRASPARIEIEVDGQIVATTALSTMGSLNNASAVLRLGLLVDGTSPMDVAGPGLALFGGGMTAPSIEQLRMAFADDSSMFTGKCLLQGGSYIQDIAYDSDTDLLYVAKAVGGTDVLQGPSVKGAMLSTSSTNLMPGAGSAIIWSALGGALAGNLTAGNDVPGVTAWGRGKLTPLTENNVTAEHWYRTLAITLAAGTYTMGFLSKAGSRSWGRIWFTGAAQSIFFNTATGAAGAVVGVTPLPSVDLGGGIWLIQFTFTLASQWTGAPYFYPAISNGTTNYAGDNGVSGAAIFFGDPIIRTGSTALTVNDFQSAMSRSDNHKFVSAHDSNVLIATAAGADIVLPALPLRSGVRGRRSAALYDPDVSKFNGRITADATPTFIGDPIFVPEGGKVDFLISVTAAVPGGTASELVTTLLKGRAYRNIGDAVATIFVSAVSGSPALPDKTTGTMDATVASMGGGWIGVRVTGKANTPVEWLGRQSLVRAA